MNSLIVDRCYWLAWLASVVCRQDQVMVWSLTLSLFALWSFSSASCDFSNSWGMCCAIYLTYHYAWDRLVLLKQYAAARIVLVAVALHARGPAG